MVFKHFASLFYGGMGTSIVMVVYSVGGPAMDMLLGLASLVTMWFRIIDIGLMFFYAKCFYLTGIVFGLLCWFGPPRGSKESALCAIAATALALASVAGFLYFGPL